MFVREDLTKERKHEPPGKSTPQRKESKHKGTETEQCLCVPENGNPNVTRAGRQEQTRKSLPQSGSKILQSYRVC